MRITVTLVDAVSASGDAMRRAASAVQISWARAVPVSPPSPPRQEELGRPDAGGGFSDLHDTGLRDTADRRSEAAAFRSGPGGVRRAGAVEDARRDVGGNARSAVPHLDDRPPRFEPYGRGGVRGHPGRVLVVGEFVGAVDGEAGSRWPSATLWDARRSSRRCAGAHGHGSLLRMRTPGPLPGRVSGRAHVRAGDRRGGMRAVPRAGA
jgi:hypothetical protein